MNSKLSFPWNTHRTSSPSSVVCRPSKTKKRSIVVDIAPLTLEHSTFNLAIAALLTSLVAWSIKLLVLVCQTRDPISPEVFEWSYVSFILSTYSIVERETTWVPLVWRSHRSNNSIWCSFCHFSNVALVICHLAFLTHKEAHFHQCIYDRCYSDMWSPRKCVPPNTFP